MHVPGFRAGWAAALILNLTHKVPPLPSHLLCSSKRATIGCMCQASAPPAGESATWRRSKSTLWRYVDAALASFCAVFGRKGRVLFAPSIHSLHLSSHQVGALTRAFPNISGTSFPSSARPLLQADVDGKTQQPTKVTNAES